MSQDDALAISPIQPLPLPQITKPQDHDASLEELPSPLPTEHTFLEGGLQAWLVVAGSFCVIAGSFGFQSSIGIFQSYWLMHQLSSYSSSEVGWISAVNIFLALFLGVQIGPMFDRWGPRWLLLSGSVAWVASLFTMAQCETYWQFMLVFGIVAGVANALLTTTGVAVIAHWFEAKRGQANGIVFIGSSFGGITIPLIMRPLLDKLGWAWAIRVLALVILVLMVIGNVLIRGRLPKGTRGGAIDLRCFLDSRFTWATIGIAGMDSQLRILSVGLIFDEDRL
jgi:MFS family permease